MAHVWHHAFPVARRFPRHARGADDIAAPTPELLPEEPGAGCTAELLFDSEPEGESAEAGGDEQCGQGESGGLIKSRSFMAMTCFYDLCKVVS